MFENHARPSTISLFAILATSLAIAWNGAAAELTLEVRVDHRRVIEEVYWQHRIWPEQSQATKPPLSEALPEEILRERVEDSLRLSRALAERWQRPITSEDLQTELDRMVRETTSPERLEELFAALGHDPQTIAEVLARPLLADRLVREAFASDPEIHGGVRRRAEAEYADFAFVEDLWQASGTYREVTWLRWGDGVAKHELMAEQGDGERLYLDPIQWQEKTDWLDERVGGVARGEIGDLREDPIRLSAVAVLERGEARIRLAIVEWRKPELDSWWLANRDDYLDEILPLASTYELQPIESTTGTPNSWQSVGSTGSPPHARSNHTAIWTGSEMIIWGGDDGIGYVYSGSIYDPATSSWTAMTNTDHPLGRFGHTAVWTGSKMVVWGGDRGTPTDTGGRYDPTTGTWQSTATSGAPSARFFHTAVANNSNAMTIWGGWNGSSYLGDGFRYNVSSNSWLSITGTDAPSARSDHAAVGYIEACGFNELAMVVFGGQDTEGVLGDGAYYCYPFSSWTALASESAPSARMGHSAVATARGGLGYREVIIWGGNDGTNDLNTGARWEQNQWKPTNLGGAPSARQGHSAVWAGSGMMIWGGHSGATLRNSGAVYNPDNNVWLSMTTTGAPTARKAHAAVWSGANPFSSDGQMIVWGGTDGAPTSSGKLYSRPADFVVDSYPRIVTTVPGGAELTAFVGGIRSNGGFNDTVSMSHTAFPGSLMIWDDSLTPPANGFASTDVDIFVSDGASLGDHTYYFKGTSGSTVRFFEMTLRVEDYQLSCLPSSVTLAPGGSTSATCTVSSFNGFDDTVALTCDAQTGTSCSLTDSSVTPPRDGAVQVLATISVGASVVPETYTVDLTAQSHLAERLSSIEVVVDGGSIFVDGFE